MDAYQIVNNAMDIEKVLTESLSPNQTELSDDKEKALDEKRYLVKLTLLGTSVGISVAAWQLLRNPQMRASVIQQIKQRQGKQLWKSMGVPIAGGIAIDTAAQPAIGWTARRWQDTSNKLRQRRKSKGKK